MIRHFFSLRRAMACCVCAIACFLSLGCNRGEPVPELMPVTGKVTFQGNPLADASISFVFADEDIKKPARVRPAARTDEQGEYSLAWNELDGAPAGNYQIMIIAFKPGTDGDSEVKPESLIPEKYNSPKTSGLTAAVTEDGENVFNFKL